MARTKRTVFTHSLSFSVSIQGQTVDLELDKELEIDDGDIGNQLATQPGKYAWWATLCEVKREELEGLETQLKRLYSSLDQQFRELGLPNAMKITEGALESAIHCDTDYQQAESAALEARAQYRKLWEAKEAFQHRRDMLIQISANLRQERGAS